MDTVTLTFCVYHTKATQMSCVAAPSRFSYRINECVRGLDVTESRVQRQAEADGVVQTGLKANRSGKNHVSEGTNNINRENMLIFSILCDFLAKV